MLKFPTLKLHNLQKPWIMDGSPGHESRTILHQNQPAQPGRGLGTEGQQNKRVKSARLAEEAPSGAPRRRKERQK